MAYASEIEIAGPFKKGEVGRAAIYMLRGPYQDQDFMVGIVVQDNQLDLDLASKNVEEVFNLVLDTTSKNMENWRNIPCFTIIIEPSDSPNTRTAIIIANKTTETSLERVAEEILSTLVFQGKKDASDGEYSISESLSEEVPGIREIRVQKMGEEIGTTILANDGLGASSKEDLAEMYSELRPYLDERERAMYLQETIGYIKADNPIFAFRSYYYAILFSAKNTKIEEDEVIDVGMYLMEALRKKDLPDYVEWVASTVAKRSEKACRYNEAIEAWRYAAIACECMGRLQECRDHYENAIKILDLSIDERIKARLQMSYGISLVVLLSHWEAESIPMKSDNTSISEMISCAERHLMEAKDAIAKFDDETAKWSLSSIGLDLVRLEDLKGDHLKAMNRLRDLLTSSSGEIICRDSRLVSTTSIYNIMIHKKLADEDPKWRGAYYQSLNDADSFLKSLPFVNIDKGFLFHIFRGDAALISGYLDEALRDFQEAYALQIGHDKSEVRPPQPDSKYGRYGGWQIVDVRGRLQRALLEQKHDDAANLDEDTRSRAFLVADEAKGRFFRRDITLSMFKPQKIRSTMRYTYGKSLRDALMKGTFDHRILMADYEWYVKKDLESDGDDDPALELGVNLIPEVSDIWKALSVSPCKVALVSLYAASQCTYAYVIRNPKQVPLVFKLDIDLNKLEKIVSSLQTGINGSQRYPPIESKNPELRTRFFKPFLELGEMFNPIISALNDSDLIFLSPHGMWHNLPLHVLILPALWDLNKSPAFSYIPSLNLLDLIRQRYASKLVHFKSIGLTTTPAADDSDTAKNAFVLSHQLLASIFKESGVTLVESFGNAATADRFFQDTQNVGLHHVLAHGRFEIDDNPMKSGLLLADNKGLGIKGAVLLAADGRAALDGLGIMANGTSADHVTIQACSLGRSYSSRGDEFWGISRALLAAGASSVIAPLWDIDLESSTVLLCSFYKKWLIDKQPKLKAWSEAQRDFYLDRVALERSHFFHWGAFCMIGF